MAAALPIATAPAGWAHRVISDRALTRVNQAGASQWTPAELAAARKADNERWGPLVKAIGFSADD